MAVWLVLEKLPREINQDAPSCSLLGCCADCDGAPDGGHTRDGVCCQRDEYVRHLFVGGCCAVTFYNEDRDNRAEPDLVDQKDDDIIEDCEHGEKK